MKLPHNITAGEMTMPQENYIAKLLGMEEVMVENPKKERKPPAGVRSRWRTSLLAKKAVPFCKRHTTRITFRKPLL